MKPAENTTLAPASAEQAADLAVLMHQANETAPGAPGAAPAAAQVNQAEQWAMFPQMIGSALCMAMPELQQVYTPDACRAWGEAMAPVAAKYGWEADGIMGPEVGLLVVSLPFLMGTMGAIRARKMPPPRAPEKQEKPEIPQGSPLDGMTGQGVQPAPGETATR